MHELGIAHSIFDLVRKYVPRSQAEDVRAVRVRVGELAGILPESLQFCFEAIVEGTPYASARLAIERVPVRCRCNGCGHLFDTAQPVFACPACHSPRVELVAGSELQVVDVEVREREAALA